MKKPCFLLPDHLGACNVQTAWLAYYFWQILDQGERKESCGRPDPMVHTGRYKIIAMHQFTFLLMTRHKSNQTKPTKDDKPYKDLPMEIPICLAWKWCLHFSSASISDLSCCLDRQTLKIYLKLQRLSTTFVKGAHIKNSFSQKWR